MLGRLPEQTWWALSHKSWEPPRQSERHALPHDNSGRPEQWLRRGPPRTSGDSGYDAGARGEDRYSRSSGSEPLHLLEALVLPLLAARHERDCVGGSFRPLDTAAMTAIEAIQLD